MVGVRLLRTDEGRVDLFLHQIAVLVPGRLKRGLILRNERVTEALTM